MQCCTNFFENGSFVFLVIITATANVMISAAGGAVRTEPIPKTAGIMNMAKAFITAPLHMAMISDCFVLLVEYSSEVYTRFKPIGIKGRLKTGNAFAAAVTSSGSRLKMLP